MQIIFAILLGICMIHDLYDKTIPVVYIWIYLGLALVYRIHLIVFQKGSITESFICLLPGIMLLFFSYVSSQMGSGDGWLILVGGLYLKWEKLLALLVYSFMAAGVFSLIFLIITRRSKKERIPFVPFLFFGTLVIGGRDLL